LRCAAIAGAAGTSNVAAALRYGLELVGMMAHSYVLSFDGEEEAFRTLMRDTLEKRGQAGALSRGDSERLQALAGAWSTERPHPAELADAREDSPLPWNVKRSLRADAGAPPKP